MPEGLLGVLVAFASVVVPLIVLILAAGWLWERSEPWRLRREKKIAEQRKHWSERRHVFQSGLNWGGTFGFMAGMLVGWWLHGFAMG